MTGLTIPKMVESSAFSQHKLFLENPCWTITFALIYILLLFGGKWPNVEMKMEEREREKSKGKNRNVSIRNEHNNNLYYIIYRVR